MSGKMTTFYALEQEIYQLCFPLSPTSRSYMPTRFRLHRAHDFWVALEDSNTLTVLENVRHSLGKRELTQAILKLLSAILPVSLKHKMFGVPMKGVSIFTLAKILLFLLLITFNQYTQNVTILTYSQT